MSESKDKKKGKPKKKRANLRKDLAVKKYLDPKSDTFGSKVKSMLEAGYSESMAKHQASEVLSEGNFTDTQLAKLEPLIADLPPLCLLCKKKLLELASGERISAKDYAVMLKHIELLLKAAGILKQVIEKRELHVNVIIPLSKCPNCGYEMDIMKREYERGENEG